MSMDKRLLEAARTGNVNYFNELIQADSLILSAVALTGGETPLHIAAMAGHLSFVQAILKLRPTFAQELNQDGYGALHIASANGYLEIVKELLEVDSALCLLKGREGRIPLHYAAIKGRVNVIKELLSAWGDSIEAVTARGETALHLAVKNNQFEAFRVLVEHLKEFNKEDVLNKKDDQGNTTLHLAVSRKQYEVIDLVLKEHTASKGVVEVNSLNARGLTALDVLLLFHSDAGDREIEEILLQSGAVKAGEMQSLAEEPVNQNQVHATNPSIGSSNDQAVSRTPQSRIDELFDYFKYKKGRDKPSKVRDVLLVVTILILTATYQAGLSPPGGVWPDDSPDSTTRSNKSTSTSTGKQHSAGRAILGSRNSGSFAIFMVCNSVGFFTSLYMINFLTGGFPLQLELQISMVALAVTYDTSMVTIAPNSGMTRFFSIFSIVFPIVIPIVVRVARARLRRPRHASGNTNHESA